MYLGEMISPTPTIIEIPSKQLIGFHDRLNYATYNVVPLWQKLMPIRNQIPGKIGDNLFSVQYFHEKFFVHFSPLELFDKWAGVEVEASSVVPEGAVSFTIEGGLYAVFSYKGYQSGAQEAFQYILGVWLPSSEYQLDDRKHFEILDHRYKKNDPDSEEDIYIPIRKR